MLYVNTVNLRTENEEERPETIEVDTSKSSVGTPDDVRVYRLPAGGFCLVAALFVTR